MSLMAPLNRQLFRGCVRDEAVATSIFLSYNNKITSSGVVVHPPDLNTMLSVCLSSLLRTSP